MRVLTSQDLERVLSFPVCIEEMRRAMIATSARQCALPLRQFMPVPNRAGKLGLMPGYIGGDDECFGVKIVSKFERAAGDPHGSHVGAVLLFDAATGLLRAMLEGGTLTAIRTASMTALATATLARADARRLLIVGAGEEAWYHGRALLHARPFDDVEIWARDPARAAALATRLRDWRIARAAQPKKCRRLSKLGSTSPHSRNQASCTSSVACSVCRDHSRPSCAAARPRNSS